MTEFTRVAVLGAGTMGHALALVHALGGCQVRLQDISAAALERAPSLIDAALATLTAAGGLARDQANAAAARITTVATLPEAVGDADLVVEAIAEDPEIKRQVFGEIDAAAPMSAIIASNTSYLEVFPLVPERRKPTSLIAHWYSPPYIVDLVDLAPGPETRPDVIEQMRQLYAGWGKEPIVFKDMLPGYVANRIQAAISLEVHRLLDEGRVTPEDVDRSIRHGLALRFALQGHLRKSDFAGLTLVRQAMANAPYTPPPVTGRSATIDKLVAEGRTGVMAGAGFYDYGGRPAEELFRERDHQLLALKRSLAEIERS